MEKVLVYGAGEFGELIENLLFYKSELEITAFCDDDASLIDSDKNGKPVIAGIEAKHYVKENRINIGIVAIGKNKIRAKKYEEFQSLGLEMISIAHPKALIDTKVTIGKNVIIEMGTAIHTNTIIGDNVFLGGEALLGHHNKIGNHILVGGGAALGGSVTIDDFATIGVGSAIKPGVSIGKNSIIGVGAVVVKDVPNNVVVAGVPARIIKEL